MNVCQELFVFSRFNIFVNPELMTMTDFKSKLVASVKLHRGQQYILSKEYLCSKLGIEFWRPLHIIHDDKGKFLM